MKKNSPTHPYLPPNVSRDGDTEVSYFKKAKRRQAAIQSQILAEMEGSPKLPYVLAETAHDHSVEFLNTVGPTFEIDCEAGCSYCCHQPATVFPFEAIQIARLLKQTRSPADLDLLIKKMETRVAEFSGASVRKNMNNKTPCPLLADGQCSIYADRPLTCRMAHSHSVKRCRQSFQGDRGQVQIPASFSLHTGMSGIIEGLFDHLPQFGLDGSLYELCSAVLVALANPDVDCGWARGDQSAFREAIRDDT